MHTQLHTVKVQFIISKVFQIKRRWVDNKQKKLILVGLTYNVMLWLNMLLEESAQKN